MWEIKPSLTIQSFQLDFIPMQNSNVTLTRECNPGINYLSSKMYWHSKLELSSINKL